MIVEEAERIAIKALAFLAADAERLGRFLGTTGLGPQELREKAGAAGGAGVPLRSGAAGGSLGLCAGRRGDHRVLPGFGGTAGKLDYVLADEAMVIEFCRALGVPPGNIGQARAQLPGYSPPM